MNKLPKAPLQEVILEIKWELQMDSSTGFLTDPGFQLALGKFHQSIQNNFPLTVQKFPNDVPIHILGQQALHQFWKAKNEWPVIQIGPGILIMNEVEQSYDWDNSFYPLIVNTLEKLNQAYQGNIPFNSFALRYIDAVKVSEYAFTNWPAFFKKNINFDFSNNFDANGAIAGFNFDQTFNLKDNTSMKVIFSSGNNQQGELMFFWQIVVQVNDLFTKDALTSSIQHAHNITSQKFKDICKKDFYGSFSTT
jgi:uncharacterized protein (TIGR04255 family)